MSVFKLILFFFVFVPIILAMYCLFKIAENIKSFVDYIKKEFHGY